VLAFLNAHHSQPVPSLQGFDQEQALRANEFGHDHQRSTQMMRLQCSIKRCKSAAQAMQRLRDEWQAVVVARLMHVKDVLGMPLARRQRDEQSLAELRAAGELASQRIGLNGSGAGAAKAQMDEAASMHVIPMDLLVRGAIAALCGRSLAEVQVDIGEPRAEGEGTARAPTAPVWGAPSWPALRERFATLHPRHRQVGVDDSEMGWFQEQAIAEAEAVLRQGRIDRARASLRTGAPVSCRARLWDAALAIPRVGARCASVSDTVSASLSVVRPTDRHLA
jgi:hypothetical protein